MHTVVLAHRPVLTEASPGPVPLSPGDRSSWSQSLFANAWGPGKQTSRTHHGAALGARSCILVPALHFHNTILAKLLNVSKPQ